MAVDADGAFRAYHPTNRLGLDAIVHAGYPGNWWALATDTGETKGHPVLQRKGDPAPGYYVSMTSLFDATNSNEHDPHRYVDAAKIPYVVLPPALQPSRRDLSEPRFHDRFSGRINRVSRLSLELVFHAIHPRRVLG